MVVAQLIERSLLTPEVRGANHPVIGKTLDYLYTVNNCIEKTKIKKKSPGMSNLKHFHLDLFLAKNSLA